MLEHVLPATLSDVAQTVIMEMPPDAVADVEFVEAWRSFITRRRDAEAAELVRLGVKGTLITD